MKKYFFFITAFIFFLSSPLLANEVKPGKWSIEQSMKGDQLPPGMPEEKTETDCLTDQEATDLERTLRQNWQRIGCANPQVDHDGDTMTWNAECESSGRTMDAEGSMTVHNKEHYSTTITTRTNGTTLTIEADAQWAGSSCEG